jgi:hypothetical protein
VYSIEFPQTGKWSIIADGSDQFSILVNGKSDLSFDSFRFVETGGRPGHTGAFPISGSPAPGKVLFAQATLTGAKQLLSYEFRNRTGTVLSRFSLASNDAADTQTQTGEVTVPAEPFNVYAVGEDDNRLNFQRVIATTFNPQNVTVVAPVAVTLPRGQTTTYFFKVQNSGAADTFIFSVLDDKKYIASMSTASATLGTGDATIVKVTLNPSVAEPVGTVDTLTFSAQSTSVSDASNFAVLSSPVVAATLAGDVNRDGKIDCDDLGLVRASFGARAGDRSFNPNVDIDNNGVVDARDLAFVARLVSVGTTCK